MDKGNLVKYHGRLSFEELNSQGNADLSNVVLPLYGKKGKRATQYRRDCVESVFVKPLTEGGSEDCQAVADLKHVDIKNIPQEIESLRLLVSKLEGTICELTDLYHKSYPSTDSAEGATIFFYDERINNHEGYMARFGVQLVLGDAIESESHFLHSGSLQSDRQKSREYGEAVGKKLHELGIDNYVLTLNKNHANMPCVTASKSDISYLVESFEEAVKDHI